MKFYADFHIHSKYSRATSSDCDLEHLHAWAQIKGVRVVGTGDFTHPAWLDEMENKLIPAENGLFRLKPEHVRAVEGMVPPACRAEVRFMLTAEISNIYKRMDAVRKVHNVVFAPGFSEARMIASRLDAIGNIRSDGRPILGLDSRDLLEIILETSPQCFLVPAHIWTPWFSVLGSKSGFNAVADCYGDLTSHLFAMETGLSSDPPMNWRLSQLDPYVLISNSDAHSPQKLGREANIFDTECSYPSMLRAMKQLDDKGFVGTIEFFPQEGKYHFDGHRTCGARMHPQETIEHRGRCPVCARPVTVGVMARVEELADRPEGAKGRRWRPFYRCIPLNEILGDAMNAGAGSKNVLREYDTLMAKVGSELFVLRDAPLEDIRAVSGDLAAEGIRRMRDGRVKIDEGYDGEYGTVRLFEEHERKGAAGQFALFAFSEIPSKKKQKRASGKTTAGTEPPYAAPPLSVQRRADQAGRDGGRKMEVALGEKPDDLNETQWEAVLSDARHLLIIAGPGTGKTHTLIHRIVRAAAAIRDDDRLLAITFTNRAAEEMRDRLRTRCTERRFAQVDIGTFHGFCLGLLRKHGNRIGFTDNIMIASPAEIDALARRIWPSATAAERAAALEKIARERAGIPRRGESADIISFERFLREQSMVDFDGILRETWRLLEKHPDVRRMIHAVYRHVFIDEYQDINGIQHALLLHLAGNRTAITVIGDPNQSIYGFRGSDVTLFNAFTRAYPDAVTVRLGENYRSSKRLLDACGQVIAKQSQFDVPAPAAKIHAEGRLIIHAAQSDRAEAEYVVHQIEKLIGGTTFFSRDSGRVGAGDGGVIGFGDCAVLYRLNAQRRALEEAFERSGMPYRISGAQALADVPVAADAINAVRLVSGRPVSIEAVLQFYRRLKGDGAGQQLIPAMKQWRGAGRCMVGWDDIAARKDLNGLVDELAPLRASLLERGLCQTLDIISSLPSFSRELVSSEHAHNAWVRLMRLARAYPHAAAFIDSAGLQREDDAEAGRIERVSLCTLHAAKGLEFSVVFITGCEERLIPLSIQGMESDAQEERRLLYVGMTRAKRYLYITHAAKRTLYGTMMQNKSSPFLGDIEDRLKHYDRTQRQTATKRQDSAEQLSLF